MQIFSKDPIVPPVDEGINFGNPSTPRLYEKGANLDALVEHLDGFVWSIDADMQYIVLNNALRILIKEAIDIDVKPGDKMLNILGMLDPTKTEEWELRYKQAFAGTGQQFVQHFTFGGKLWHYEISINPMRKDGVITGISCYARDVTDAVNNRRLLEENEIRFRTLIENSTDVIVVVSTSGDIVYGSPSLENHFGLAKEDYSGINAFSFIFEEDLSDLAIRFVEVLDTPGIPMDIKCRAKNKDGSIIWVEGIVTNLAHVEGVNGIVCNFRDVTEKIKAAMELEAREQRFRLLIENSADFIMMANQQGEIIYGSPSIQKFLGYSEEDYFNKTAFMLIHPDSFPDAHILLENLFKYPNETFSIRFKLYHKDGHDVWVEGVATNLLDTPGINAIVGNFKDISERKRAEQLIRESEDLYKNLFNKSPLPTWVCCTETLQYLEANEAAVQHYGYSKEEFLQRTAFEITPAENHNELMNFLATGDITNQQQLIKKHVKKNGEIVFVEVLAHTISYKGQPCYLVVAKDITEELSLRHQLVEEKIMKQKEIMQAAMEGQDKERAEIGRELHDNVKQILGVAKVCLEHGKGNAAEQVKMIDKAHKMISDAIEELRELSKSLTQVYQREIGLELSVENLVDSMRVGNTIDFEIKFAVPNEKYMDDKLKMTLFRIIQEQLNNIVQHAEALHVVIMIKQMGDVLSLCIADDGKGFDISKKRSGIGITNIINRAEIFNGHVVFDSEPGAGCRMLVNFKIPV